MKTFTNKMICFLSLLAGMTANAREGGISAGGGGLQESDRLSVQEVSSLIRDSRWSLLMYFNYASFMADSQTRPHQTKIYSGPVNIIQMLSTVEIEIKQSTPCIDGLGNKLTAEATLPNHVCISASELSAQLIPETAQKEVIALLAHELSHLLGMNEAEAKALQKEVKARAYPYFSPDVEGFVNYGLASWQISQERTFILAAKAAHMKKIEQLRKAIPTKYKSTDLTQVSIFMTTALKEGADQNPPRESVFKSALLHPELQKLATRVSLESAVTNLYLEAVANRNTSYDQLFGTKKSMSLKEVCNKMPAIKICAFHIGEDYKNTLVVRKIQKLTDYRASLTVVIEGLQILAETIANPANLDLQTRFQNITIASPL
ncbi:MAG: hypothetical protein AB7O96_04575 [Pseudobdellovibrionaceae bacterium]